MTLPLPGEGADVEILPAYLQLVLDKVVGTFEQAGIELPERRYIAYGDVAADCEQLTVQFQQLYDGSPGGNPNAVQQCDGPRSVVMVVELFRCVPTTAGPRGGPPSPEAMDASTVIFLKDAWLLLDSADQVSKASGWAPGFIVDVNPISPSGGFAGTRMNLTTLVP